MKTIEWLLETSLNGCDLHGSVEVEDAATEDEIETAVREDMWDRLSLTWWEKDRPDTSEGEPSALIERLHRSIQTAFNDDYSEVGTDKRLRHAARIDAMQDAADALARQSAEIASLGDHNSRLQRDIGPLLRRVTEAEAALADARQPCRNTIRTLPSRRFQEWHHR